MHKTTSRLWTLASLALLAACGGGGGGGGAGTPPLVTGRVTLAGVVSIDAPVPQAAVEVKCAAGTGSATARSDGTYQVSLDNASLPCVVGATSTDNATKLHSVATGPQGDASVTANVTSLTELMVAQLAGTSPEDFFTTVTPATLAGAVTAAKVEVAQDKVKVVLENAGIDTTGLGNFVTDTLIVSNTYGQVLVLLDQTMTNAGSSLRQLATTVATSAAGAGTTGNVATPTTTTRASLSAELLLNPKAADCAALRSTTYRIVHVRDYAGPGAAYDDPDYNHTITVDAQTLQVTDQDGTVETWASVGAGTCRYTTQGGATEIVVAPSGLLLARAFDSVSGTAHAVIGLPVQTIGVADTAGTWNVAAYELDGINAGQPTFKFGAPVGVIDSTGQITSARCVENDTIVTPLANCALATGPLPRMALVGGKLTFLSDDPADLWQDRVHGYRAGNGDLLLVTQNESGGVNLFTPQRVIALPPVNASVDSLNLPLALNGTASALTFTTRTFSSVNSANQSYVRRAQTTGDANSAHDETLFINNARPGYTHRPAGSSPNAGGTTSTFRSFYALALQGMGASVVFLPRTNTAPAPSNESFQFSVDLP